MPPAGWRVGGCFRFSGQGGYSAGIVRAMDPRLADALLEAGIIDAEQADRLRAAINRRLDELWGPHIAELQAGRDEMLRRRDGQ